MKDAFDAIVERGILAYGFLRLRCGDCGHDKLVDSALDGLGFASSSTVAPPCCKSALQPATSSIASR